MTRAEYRSTQKPLRKMAITEEALRVMVVDRKMTDVAIGKQLGVCAVTVMHWRKRFDLPGAYATRGMDRAVATMEELQAMYVGQKWTMAELAKRLRVGESTVRQYLIRCGLQLSPEEVASRRAERNQTRYPQRMEGRGYRRLRMPYHPNASRGYIGEHCVVVEMALGRFLNPGEQVHHINLEKLENQAENLAVLPGRTEHALVHKYMERVAAYLCGLTKIAPAPLAFGTDIFWGGRYLRTLDLLAFRPDSVQDVGILRLDAHQGNPVVRVN